jgi:hypothetical protein
LVARSGTDKDGYLQWDIGNHSIHCGIRIDGGKEEDLEPRRHEEHEEKEEELEPRRKWTVVGGEWVEKKGLELRRKSLNRGDADDPKGIDGREEDLWHPEFALKLRVSGMC